MKAKDLSAMTPSEVAAQMLEWFPYLRDLNHPTRYRSKEDREREIQYGAGNDHFKWWIEQNRIDAMRRGE
jgi:hypothetical protein